MPREEKKNKTIAIVAYPGVALLDLVVTKTVLDRGTSYRTISVGERTEPMDSNTPMTLIPEKRFEEGPDPFAIIVPGGGMASVGLLEGRQATTHWVYYKILEQFRAEYVRKRWVEDGKFISSSGVSSGIDLVLHLAAILTDEVFFLRIQRSTSSTLFPPTTRFDPPGSSPASSPTGAG